MQAINKKNLLLGLLIITAISFMSNGQSLAVKTDLFTGIALVSPNVGVEHKITDQTTVDLSVHYNPLPRRGDLRWRHWLVSAEVKYWFCNVFSGHFAGARLLGGGYNIAKLDLPVFKDLSETRRQGYLGGIGAAYGYHWAVTPRWGIEFEVGGAIGYTSYDIYKCYKCGEKIGDKSKLFVTPTLSLSLVYIIK